MRSALFVVAALVSFPRPALADRRALVVGINKYDIASATAAGAPGAGRTRGQRWTDLDGAVSDAQAMRELLGHKYGFKDGEMHVLLDGEATRARILSEIDDFLVKGTKPGDLRLFYYAGHGSQVRNSKSAEWDKLDETIVPADVGKLDRGDIRDKELGRRFNQILDARGELVVVLDSCHSGSMARGLPEGKLRAAPTDERDVADATPPPRAPESRGALVLSAAADYQTAAESVDAEQHPRGLFSLSLFEVLARVPVDEPVERVFAAVRAVMQRDGRAQEPVLGATDERKKRTLLGSKAGGGASGRVPIAVMRVGTQGDVELRGGLADGLAAGCELVKVAGGKRVEGVRVRIERVRGMASATGRLVRGRADEVREGDLLVVDRWAPADVAALRVFLPPSTLPAADALAFDKSLSQLTSGSDAKHITWINTPTITEVSHTIAWDGLHWTLTPSGAVAEPLPSPLRADTLSRRVLETYHPRRDARGHALDDKPVVFISLPPTPQLLLALRESPQIKNHVLDATDVPVGTQYRLVGRALNGELEYAWARAYAPPDGGDPLPAKTDWVRLTTDDTAATVALAAKRLDELGRRLGTLHAWLTLPSPDASFPYHLGLRKRGGGGPGALLIGRPGESVTEGETYDLVLVPDTEARLRAGWDARFVYVFALDSDGRGTLLFPPFGRENRVPAVGAPTTNGTGAPPELVLGAGLEIAPPFGLDTYVLLATGDKLTDPSVLELDPVRTREAVKQRGAEDALGALLSTVGTRGPRPLTPPNWSLERMPVRSRAK